MHRWKTIVFNITFALNCLLLFLIVFDQQLQVPVWLQIAGRMHPLILHFPIVLLVLTIFWELLPRSENPFAVTKTRIGDLLLLSAAFSAVITSLMGLFLSREGGYTPDVLDWHKWGGTFISLLTCGWYAFRHRVRQAKPLLVTTAGLSLVVIIVTGHQGANITHGENFLLAPLAFEESKPNVLLEDAQVYAHMVKPILEGKCMGCHNQKKAKGELVMETEAALLKGGKSGALWDTTEKDFGLMFKRIHLPLDHKKHMPPRGKPQLTDEEIAILYQWVKEGVDFNVKVASLPESDSLRLLAENRFGTVETDAYTFETADEETIKKLNTNYRVIAPLAAGSPALGVEFFSAAQFHAGHLKELLPVKEQIITLNLNKMPVTDEDLKIVTAFPNLRKLNLSFTRITGAGLSELNRLQKLKHLSLSGTSVKGDELRKLAALPNLSRLYLWQTGVHLDGLKQVQSHFKNAVLEAGYEGDTVVIKLNPPLIENDEQIIKEPVALKLKHYINGAVIRYTTDGSDPDSTQSPVYSRPITIDKNTVLKTKAYKKGWISSDIVEKHFYKAGFLPDSVQLVNAPDPQYKGDGGETLVDAEKGDLNTRSGRWLGYREKPLVSLLYFNEPIPAHSVTVSALVNIGGYIFPPKQIEVWGGSDPAHLQLLKRMTPQQPASDKPGSLQRYDVVFQPNAVQVIKLIVTPVPKLPSWHRGKGEKGWVFVDEVLVN